MRMALLRVVTATTHAAPVAACRIALAFAALVKFVLFAAIAHALLDPRMLRVPFWTWLPPAPAQLLLLVLAPLGFVAALAFLVGFRTRSAGALLVLTIVAFMVADQQLYSNHTYLLATLAALLVLADAGASHSLDARRGAARATLAAWPVLLIRLQITVAYAFAAITKLNLEFVSGAVLNAHIGRGALLPFPDALRIVEVMAPLAMAAIATELFLAFGLWFARTRIAAVVLGIGFHGAIILTMVPAADLVVFALVMFAGYLSFFGTIRGLHGAAAGRAGVGRPSGRGRGMARR